MVALLSTRFCRIIILTIRIQSSLLPFLVLRQNATLRYETKEREFVLPDDNHGEMYYASVQIVESHGYSSQRSEPLDMLFVFNEIKPPAPNSADDAAGGSSSHVYVAVAVGVVIAVVLAASLLLLLVRHRRLQRSFVSFASTHWNSGNPGVSFSDQTLGIKALSVRHLS